jgi:hypothetical protein
MTASLERYSNTLFNNQDRSAWDDIELVSPVDELLPGDLPRELGHNFVRDGVWTGFSSLNWNILGQTMPALDLKGSLTSLISSGAFLQPVAAQWLFGSAPLMIFATGETIYRKLKGETLTPEELRKIWAAPTAAAAAIPMWDLGQVIGGHLGSGSLFQHSAQWFGSSIAAGMMAAPFCGVLEGFTQFTVKYLFDVATNPVTRAMWREEPGLMGKVLVKDLLLNVTIGAIPGAVWQIVFFFVLPLLMATALGPVGGIIVAALLVALAVMLCNFACTHAINKAGGAINHLMGWDLALEDLKKRIETQSRKKNPPEKIVEFPKSEPTQVPEIAVEAGASG